MWRIALLEDEQAYINIICHITEEYMKKNGIPYEIHIYTSAEGLLKDLYKGEEDIYLLDIELPDGNGLEVAKRIRERGEWPFIIYITNYVQYAIAAFEVNTFRYIPKTVLIKKLPEAYQAIKNVFEKRERHEGYYLIDSRNKTVKVKYKDIIYLKKEGSYVRIVCTGVEYRVRKMLTELVNELNYPHMIIIERGYAVNLQHVDSLKDHQVHLSDGTSLLVARSKWKTVRETFLKDRE